MTAHNHAAPSKGSVDHPQEAMRDIRSRIVQSTFLIAALVGIPAVTAAAVQTLRFGWENVVFLYIGAIVMAWYLVFFGKRLPLGFRIGLIFGSLFLIGLDTLYTWGLMGTGFFWFILLCLLAVVYSGREIGFVAFGISVISILGIGLSINFGWITFDTDFNAISVSHTSWFVALLSFCLVAAVIVDALGRLHSFLIDSMLRLDDQRLALQTANEALGASEEHFRTLVETSPVAMVVGDGIEMLSHVNDKFVEIFGYTIKDIPTQKEWIEKAYPDETYREKVKAKWTVNVADSLKNKIEMKPIEALVTCKNGDRRTIEFRGSLIGERTVTACNDITERKASENEMRSLRNLLANIINSMESIIIGVDRNLLVTQWNKHAVAITGNTADYALAKPLGKVFPRIGERGDPNRKNNDPIESSYSDGSRDPLLGCDELSHRRKRGGRSGHSHRRRNGTDSPRRDNRSIGKNDVRGTTRRRHGP
jgi:PAS domain S-box-containing protein